MPDGAPQLPLVKLSLHTLPLALSQRKEGKLRAAFLEFLLKIWSVR